MADLIVPIYEDNHLLVLNKPAGLLTQPSGTEQQSLEEIAKAYIKEVYQKPGKVFLEAVHRLDKPVSGLVVFCKTSKALSRMHALMREQSMKKNYWALIEGSPPASRGVLEHYLKHGDFQAEVVTDHCPEGKKARLHYRLIKQQAGSSLLEVEIETGRYHQIRVQLAAIGCPIWGDKKYGSQHTYVEGAIALHHRKLAFMHPVTHVPLQLEGSLPPTFVI